MKITDPKILKEFDKRFSEIFITALHYQMTRGYSVITKQRILDDLCFAPPLLTDEVKAFLNDYFSSGTEEYDVLPLH